MSFNQEEELLPGYTLLTVSDAEWLEKELANGRNVSVNGNGISVNGTCKNEVNSNINDYKNEANKLLKLCRSSTPPIEISYLLEIIFGDHESKNGHWLYISQHWNPREINRVLEMMIKRHNRGDVSIKNPPAYFTLLLKHRKKRKVSFLTSQSRKYG